VSDRYQGKNGRIMGHHISYIQELYDLVRREELYIVTEFDIR